MKIFIVFVGFILVTSAKGAPLNEHEGTRGEMPSPNRVIRQSAQCKGIITVRETERRSNPTTNSYIRGRYLMNKEIVLTNIKHGDDQRLWYGVEGTYVEEAYVRITQENGSGWCKIPAQIPGSTRGPVLRFLSYVFS